ncbi:MULTISPECIES: hypothetical protein [Lactococcus]|nr:hypothetical protein [Lactococcus cremoris]
MQIIKFLLFLLSMLGYSSFVRIKTHIPKYFIYIGVISFQVILLFLASLYNYLPEMSIIIYFIGLGLFIYLVTLNKSVFTAIFDNISIISIGMLFYLLVYIISLWNLKLTHYDNFTHWATIVKFLFIENRLPEATDTIITYNNYPIGSSLYLYYISKFVGFTDGILMIGQFLMITAAQYSLFNTVKDKRRILPNAIIFSSFGIITYLNFSIRYDNLLVDLLIAVITISAISIIYDYNQNYLQYSILLSLVLSLLVMIKASALLFVIITVIIFLIYYGKNLKYNRSLKYYLSPLFLTLPFILNKVWSLHVKAVFGKMVIKKHELSSGSLSKIMEGKITENQIVILKQYIKTVFSFETKSTIQISIIFLVSFVLILFFGFKYKKWSHNILIFSVNLLVSLLYYIGNLIMYLTAMPYQEAKYTAGFERYVLTVIVINFGSFIIHWIREMDDVFYEKNYMRRNNKSFKNVFNKKLYENSTMMFLIIFLGFIISDTNGMIKQNKNITIEQKNLQKIVSKKKLNKGKYLIISDNKTIIDNYFLMYYSRYQLWNVHIDVRYDFMVSEKKFKQELNGYDGFILLDNHYTFKANLKKITHKNFSPGYYSVTSINYVDQ